VDDVTTALTGRRVVLGVSGGIAAYKAVLVARALLGAGAQVDVVLTRGAASFVGPPTFEGITGRPVRSEVWEDIPDETHVALARAADVVVVYPATAHLLAKAATGLADDLLTTTLLAATCPVVLAPAMHTEMWHHPATQANAAALRDRGVTLVGPVDGPLMGGDVGPGRAADPDDVVAAVVAAVGARDDLAGRTVVVSAGGTREAIDPVRYLGNRSSGRMGFAIAAAAARRGAKVTLVAAPTDLPTPPGVDRVDVVSARDMHAAILPLADGSDVVVKAAAVADFRPSAEATRKIKKAEGVPTITLEPNPDILADLGQDRRRTGGGPTVLVGFAAETDDVEANGRAKLERKGCDLLVVNDVTEQGAGFAHDTNRVVILTADGGRVDVPLTTKAEVADRLLDEVVARLA
jgi:phosphopantothenoylcysteine decarboxylase/phosphopantothenate--cysteine ligase